MGFPTEDVRITYYPVGSDEIKPPPGTGWSFKQLFREPADIQHTAQLAVVWIRTKTI